MTTYEQGLRANYARIAATYDGDWAEVLVEHARALVDRLDLTAALRILALGCGPGRLLPHLSSAAPDALVLGADLTEAMIQRAQATYPRVVADAQLLPFSDAALDAVLVPFMLFHLPRLGDALEEVVRALRSNGVFAALTWAEHDPHPAFDLWVEVIDSFGAPPDPSPLMPNASVTADPALLRDALTTAGFEDVSMSLEPFRHAPTREQFIAHSLVIGSNARRIGLLDQTTRAAFVREAENQLARLSSDDFVESGRVLYTIARRR